MALFLRLFDLMTGHSDRENPLEPFDEEGSCGPTDEEGPTWQENTSKSRLPELHRTKKSTTNQESSMRTDCIMPKENYSHDDGNNITSRQDTESSLIPEEYKLWYRHSGMEPVAKDLSYVSARKYTAEEIMMEVGDNVITDLLVSGDLPASIGQIAPDVTNLCIQGVHDVQSLNHLRQLTRLNKLVVSRNNLSHFAIEVISSLHELTELEMGDCGLSILTGSLSKLTKLDKLDISGNAFASVPQIWSSLTSLRSLDMGSCGISSLPESFSCLTNLHRLNLSENNLQTVPEVVSYLFSLTELSMRNCNLSSLPESLTQLTQLQKLNISENDLQTVPEVVSSLCSLRELSMRDCSIVGLPHSLSCLTKLKKLSLRDNMFSCVPSVICSLTTLAELDMMRCGLPDIPRSLKLLTHLEVLNLSHNKFSGGILPLATTELLTLKELYLIDCELVDIPESISNLQNLLRLEMSFNNFETLSSAISDLKSLEVLDIEYNQFLKDLNLKMVQLSQLTQIAIDGCNSLLSPPYKICSQGLNSIKLYYADIAKGLHQTVSFATIAVIGNNMAGKTSLIRTLQSHGGKKILTNRSPDALVDETTRVFNIESVQVGNQALRFIDTGGQQTYDFAYEQLFRRGCIPVIVINMEQYKELSNVIGEREAIRRLAFDRMSHIYLGNSKLPPPKLIFTHKDKFEKKTFNNLKFSFLSIINQLRDENIRDDRVLDGPFQQVKHLSDLSTPLFLTEHIFEVGIDSTYSVFDAIKTNLLQSSFDYVDPVPELWEEVNDTIMSLPTVYGKVNELLDLLHADDCKIEPSQLKKTLRYMHDLGKVFWFEDNNFLNTYIFHRTAEIVKLLGIFCHRGPDFWRKLVDAFIPYMCTNGSIVEIEDFEDMIQHFMSTGIWDNKLLRYLIRSETAFTSENIDVAIAILQSFKLLHGPVFKQPGEWGYISPAFASGYTDADAMDKRELTLQTNLHFRGWTLPSHIYHEMSVALLDMFPREQDFLYVRKDGARVFHDDLDIRLIYNCNSRVASIHVSSQISDICESWMSLISVTNKIIERVLINWTAARVVCSSLCAHCLLVGNPHPERITNPQWCNRSLNRRQNISEMQIGLHKTRCQKEIIPSALKYPCTSLTMDELKNLILFIERLKPRKDSSGEMLVNAGISSARRVGNLAFFDDNEDLSDLSDDDEYLCPDDDLMASIKLRVKPTTNSKIKKLFLNTDKIFPMTPVRGRALIINNKNFSNRPEICREGSDADVYNLRTMLVSFNFETTILVDLKAEDMLMVLKHETARQEHQDLGMFVLVIMTHGTYNNCLFGTDLKMINLQSVYDLMTPSNFPGMGGKPKLIILAACSRARMDVGERGVNEIFPSQFGEIQEASRIRSLNSDDLLIIKSSFESSAARIHPIYGSWMIRALVSTMCKHACHRDMYEIFKSVQHKVRKLCIERNLDSGQTVVAQDTLTHLRKLYLFPGYNGR